METSNKPQKSFIFTFGKYKGEDAFYAPTDYLTWLLKQDWFKQKEEIKTVLKEKEDRQKWVENNKKRIEDEKQKERAAIIESNKVKIDNTIKFVQDNASSLLGVNLSLYAWHYDNFNSFKGVVEKVELGEITKEKYTKTYNTLEVKLYIKDINGKLEVWKFLEWEIESLIQGTNISKGRFSNSGRDAIILNK
jgi:hypothetical protein